MSILKPYRFYPKESIERRANQLLRQMKTAGNFAPQWPFEATSVADFLDLGVVWDEIQPDEAGEIAARILPTQRLIEINEKILEKPQGFIESTIAHEIGHWVLHINQDEADGVSQQLELNWGDSETTIKAEKPFVCRTASEDSKIASIEWQAQYFASCLLMPRDILLQKQRGRDLTRWSSLYEMRDELGVSISNLTNRLQDLGWITIPRGTRTIYRGKMKTIKQPFLFEWG